MSILTLNNLSSFMNSIISKASDNLKSIINLQSEPNGIFDYVQLVENIGDLTFETARQLFEETIEEMDTVFRYSQHRVHQFYENSTLLYHLFLTRTIPAACSGVGTLPILRDILSRSWLVALLPMPGYSFSVGHSIFKVLFTDELSQVYTFLFACSVCP